MICQNCLLESNYLFNELCTNCWNHDYFRQTFEFNYECPDCHGKFNNPSRNYISSITGSYVCPFCNREMKGYNG